jgi:4'-phosphopantetheinyl transferase
MPDKNEVHVWRAFLDLPASHIQSLKQALSLDERGKAERFYFQKDQNRFIVTRGLLRMILSLYLKIEPHQLRFCHNTYGKPALARECGGDTLHFNLSHSHGIGLYAVTRDREIGIDIERVRTDLEFQQIAEQFFSPQEFAVLSALPSTIQAEAFFACWTRKEAYLKARGEGLSLSLNQFDVSLAPGEPAALLSANGDPQETSRWSLHELDPGPGYVAALAVEGHSWQLKCWQWPE